MSTVAQSPVIYQPSVAEVIKATASAAHRWPTCANRLGRAADILLTGGLTLEAVAWEVRNSVNWRVASQTHAKAAYIVCGAPSGPHCPCQDSRAPLICNGRFCKHSMAVAIYSKILRSHANRDIKARKIDLGILHTGEFHAYAGCMGYVQMKRAGAAYDFCDAASAVRYSLWLAAQQPVAVPAWPVAHTVGVALAA